jgi:hypothetical protein
MHVFLSKDDPNLGVLVTPITTTPLREDHPMSRKYSLLFVAFATAIITACSAVTAPSRDEDCQTDEECEERNDTTYFCGVLAGTQTFC